MDAHSRQGETVKKNGKPRRTEYYKSTTTVKVGRDLKKHISEKSMPGESTDQTLRRIMGVPPPVKEATNET